MLPLGEADQRLLLQLARRALEESVRHHRLPEFARPEGALSEKGGAFVTLRKAGRLRGCIGYVEPVKPLVQTVLECAGAAALRDPRFDPVTPEELPHLRLEISVLSPPIDIAPDHIEVGKHGLQVSRGFQRGVLLPQVALEWKWDRKRFLEETCLKAGLAADAWQRDARIHAFTAQVITEPGDLTPSPSKLERGEIPSPERR